MARTTCHHCNTSFPTFQKWFRHANNRMYNCPRCPQQFKRFEHLRVHQQVHENRQYSCKVCSKTMKHLKSLKRHITSKHSGSEKPYQCTKCGRRFYSKWSLQRHYRRFHGQNYGKPWSIVNSCIWIFVHMDISGLSLPKLCFKGVVEVSQTFEELKTPHHLQAQWSRKTLSVHQMWLSILLQMEPSAALPSLSWAELRQAMDHCK